MKTAAEFWSRVDKRAGDKSCWPWLGAIASTGYGRIAHRYAHRLAYEFSTGPIPKGLLVLHSCDNPPCCNPAHLRIGTHQDNAREMVERGRHKGGSPKGLVPIWVRAHAPNLIAHDNGTCTKGHPTSEMVYRKTGPRAGDLLWCRVCERQRRAAKSATREVIA